MKIVLPKEHGAWAMMLAPFVIGATIHGLKWLHLPLFMGWVFLYLLSYPLLMVIRNAGNYSLYGKWLFIYGVLAAVCLTIPLYYYPELMILGALMIPFFIVNVYFAKSKQERGLMNNFSAIVILSLGSVASNYLSVGRLTEEAIYAWFLCVLFFGGSVFFVKTMIREKNNILFRYYSWLYHGLLVFLPIATHQQWILSMTYLPSLVRAIVCTNREMAPLQIGKVEILNTIFFTVCLIIYLH
ncbi:conserved hypothetical protein [Desulforamulus reducens MI-1]|uniref:YwiC-like protein n=1 Tax=Desulforamulus reducens (strain ATCC BAA-1160 / DSM 100696 / MI-1) TaxID=349161 RepID=A4J265_DESRM|nr:YwiC-like family protein [Desulforamulus reducens]ABO49168.1 conserved hypothetical protein [Desulforamulus reducens MI-1]